MFSLVTLYELCYVCINLLMVLCLNEITEDSQLGFRSQISSDEIVEKINQLCKNITGSLQKGCVCTHIFAI